MDISCRGTLDLFNCTKKYRHFDAFLITSLICSFHIRLLDMVIPTSFSLVTCSSSLPSTIIGANLGSFFTKDILSSLHYSLLSFTLFCIDHSATLSAISWAQRRLPLATTSDAVVSSTYFHTLAKSSTSKSFISTRNSHQPNFVP